jgi:hypothetical protein
MEWLHAILRTLSHNPGQSEQCAATACHIDGRYSPRRAWIRPTNKLPRLTNLTLLPARQGNHMSRCQLPELSIKRYSALSNNASTMKRVLQPQAFVKLFCPDGIGLIKSVVSPFLAVFQPEYEIAFVRNQRLSDFGVTGDRY